MNLNLNFTKSGRITLRVHKRSAIFMPINSASGHNEEEQRMMGAAQLLRGVAKARFREFGLETADIALRLVSQDSYGDITNYVFDVIGVIENHNDIQAQLEADKL